MFICSKCSATSLKWTGKCSQCGEYNSFEEKTIESTKQKSKAQNVGKQQTIHKISSDTTQAERVLFKSSELNAVLGGGLVPGSLTLLSGEPGIGKSTLVLQMADWYAGKNEKVIYVSGEENIVQISNRAKRLGIKNENISLVHASNLEDILETLWQDDSSLVIIDSISVTYSGVLDANSGSITQIRYIAEVFMEFAKRTKKSVILIGHVTKDGALAGPKVLEHLVDTVLFLEGSKYENYRILRGLKNRFWPTDEVGLFEMDENGLSDIKNPGLAFVTSDRETLTGSALTMTMEGSRPILVEIEALTTYTKFGYPKRSARWIQWGKLDLLIAVISRFTKVNLESYDTYLNVARGLTIQEPGTDLASIAAIISSKLAKPLGNIVLLWEVSLTGLIKPVAQIRRRIDEAVKLGFTTIVVPKWADTTKIKMKNIKIIEVGKISDLPGIL